MLIMNNGFVYCVTSETYAKRNIYKIGATRDINERIKAYNTHSPEKYDIIMLSKLLFDKFKTERFLKRTLETYHFRGEYYKCNINRIEDAFNSIPKKHFHDCIDKTDDDESDDEDVEFDQTFFAQTIFELAGDSFIYKRINDNCNKLYCFNGKYWTRNKIEMHRFISDQLYEHCMALIADVYSKSKKRKKLINQVHQIRYLQAKKNIVATYEEINVSDIDLDDKWWLLGFNNMVYDLQTHSFRDYQRDDYVSITTGYDWVEPTTEQIDKVNAIIKQIMPVEDERELYKILLSTALEGRCLEKFIIFNGQGGNGKGLMNDLLIAALGKYAFVGNNSILFECNKTGPNPEKANLHKKRFVVFREPPSKRKFENSVVKELTGSGQVSARSLNEKETEKTLHATIICECNKRPLFADEPTVGDLRRIIDIYFRTTFTDCKELVDEEKNIYLANIELKDKNFQLSHRTALLKILMESHKKHAENKFVITLPESIKKRTDEYIQLSCALLQWFREKYTATNDKKDILKISDIFSKFASSDYYNNLGKSEKQKINRKYLIEYFSSNVYTKTFFHERIKKNGVDYYNVMVGWDALPDNAEEQN